MSDIELQNNNIDLQKYGDGEEIIIFSPFFPFSDETVKNFFIPLELYNYQFIFSFIRDNNSKSDEVNFNYKNFLDTYIKTIKLLPNKKINLISFGIFTTLFLEIAVILKEKINLALFIEPDYSNILFKNIFDVKKRFFKNKIIKNFYLDNNTDKIHKTDFKIINMNYLKNYFFSAEKTTVQLRDLIDYIPNEIDSQFYKNKIKTKLSTKDNTFFLKYYSEKDKKLVLNKKEITENIKIKLRNILVHFEALPKVVICWNIMARESWPLAQVLEEYKIPVHSLLHNIHISITNDKNQLSEIIKNYF